MSVELHFVRNPTVVSRGPKKGDPVGIPSNQMVWKWCSNIKCAKDYLVPKTQTYCSHCNGYLSWQ